MIKDQHNHFKTYIKKAKDNDYMYHCNACKSSGFYDNLAKHLGSDSHENNLPLEHKEEIKEAIDAYNQFRGRGAKKKS